ncbi:growth-regulated alpha protein [Heterocephalus glaber]|uniref:C-X-C motif chemokine n=1 Tax=Heterocephalus glaber TaxID=10181 RepID=A0AAX6NPB8_HETGA|nr:growth-regulated alpha protein [Heterocephalus glaber]
MGPDAPRVPAPQASPSGSELGNPQRSLPAAHKGAQRPGSPSPAMAHTAPSALRPVPLLLLLLLLVTGAARRAAGAPVTTELRCRCLQPVRGLHPKSIQSVAVTAPGPHCHQTEVVATLKDGRVACLDPEAPMVQRVLQRMLSKSKAT